MDVQASEDSPVRRYHSGSHLSNNAAARIRRHCSCRCWLQPRQVFRAQPCSNLAISATSVVICGMSSGIRNGFVTYITQQNN